MSPTALQMTRVRSRRAAAATLACVALVTSALTGCGVVGAVKKVESAVQANTAVIHLFTANLTSGQPSSFEANYTTTGSAPSKITYAVRPPNDLAFTESQTGSSAASTGVSNFELIVNSRGEYLCTHATSGGAGWSCQNLPKSGAPAERALLDFYTPTHWVNFLKGFSLAAGFAGDKISSSTTTVNGFAMQCVDFVATGIAGKSRICTTTQHLLGYVQVASQSTGFEITSYTSSPTASLFDLPPGAKVTKSTSGS